MQQISIKLSDDAIDSLDDLAEDEHGGNRSEAAREIVEKGLDYDDLKIERDHAEARADQLREQMVARSNTEEEVVALRRRIEERERAADAPFPIRWLRWWRSRE
jgi:metal-responsive CopG/Arc/MetJ family transcriptional regulator